MFPRASAAVVVALAAAAASPRASHAMARKSLSLDGAGWTLTLDPADPATARIKAAGGKTSGPIVVPGAWEAQGFGEDTPTMKNQYIGVGTYTRNVSIPEAFASPPAGCSVWLVVERIQRAAKFSVGDKLIGQHMGYLSPFEGDVTSAILRKNLAAVGGGGDSRENYGGGGGGGGTLALTIEVNATRDEGVDGLQGEEDLETDNTGLGGWGGLGGHVSLELRGAGWIQHPHVQHELSGDLKTATVNATIQGKENASFWGRFYAENDHSTKTDSGQTSGKLRKEYERPDRPRSKSAGSRRALASSCR
jgi:hypothetical protein